MAIDWEYLQKPIPITIVAIILGIIGLEYFAPVLVLCEILLVIDFYKYGVSTNKKWSLLEYALFCACSSVVLVGAWWINAMHGKLPSLIAERVNLVIPSDSPERTFGADVYYRNSGTDPITGLQYGYTIMFSEQQMSADQEAAGMRQACSTARSQETNKNQVQPTERRYIKMRLRSATSADHPEETLDPVKANNAVALGQGYLHMFIVLRYLDVETGKAAITAVCRVYSGSKDAAAFCEGGFNGVYTDNCDLH